MRYWPVQYFWALRGSGGGGGGETIVHVRDTTATVTDMASASTWTMSNSTGYPLFVQTYDSANDNDEMRTDIMG